MRLILVPAALLCLTWVYQVDAIHGPATNCCEIWTTTRIPLKRVMNYTIQPEGVCPIEAIIFRTTREKNICSSPDDSWAKRAMKEVNKRRRALLQPVRSEEAGSTEDATASKRPKKQKGRKGRKGRRGN